MKKKLIIRFSFINELKLSFTMTSRFKNNSLFKCNINMNDKKKQLKIFL